MDAHNVIRFLTEGSAISMRVASQRMGRKPTFLATIKFNGRIPKLNTMAEIANVYGYDLLLRNRADGQEILIEPRTEGQGDETPNDALSRL